jgi:hypothetical protein
MTTPNRHKYICLITTLLVLLFSFNKSYSQILPPPPVPFTIHTNPAQGLYFGAFFTGSLGGTVIIYPDGTRAVTGDVIQASLGYSFAPAIFEVEAIKGTRVGIVYGPDVVLTGSNGGSMTLHLGGSSPGSPFVVNTIPPSRTQVNIGGTLTVGNILMNPVGSYTGTFSITFVQE